jgi:membrane protein
VLATLLWLAASSVFSLYVVRLAGLDTSYGPLGAAAGLMLWFYVSAWVMLLGAELNAALERRSG